MPINNIMYILKEDTEIKNLINTEIKGNTVRIVGDTNYEGQEIALTKALDIANEKELELVQVGKDDQVIICKLMNYSKYMYEQEKKKKENKKIKVVTKEIRINYGIAYNDLKIKAKQADRMLKSGSSIKISIMFRGRLITMIDTGDNKIKQLLDLIEQPFKLDKEIRKEGNKVSITIIPYK